MQLGISHYPEYYPANRWKEHFDLLTKGGFNLIRFGESSWASFQPAADVFCWDTLDSAIEMSASRGVQVILGTPTYVPPKWLVDQSPDILPVGIDGRRTVFGARQHRCFNSPAYLAAADRIAVEMVKRYGRHANVVAWQIDNELGGEHKRCYCDHCCREFHNFLRERYGSISELNRRWNTAFWGQQYSTFEEIGAPLRFSADLDMRHHPALDLDFQRFSSESIVRFCSRQYDLMRPHTDRPITHNTDTFYWGDNVNIHRLFQKLDVAGIDIYSDKLFEIAFYSDLARSISKSRTFWMMEFGTRSSGLVDELEIAKERGCEFFIFFKLLPFPWGQEIDRKALVTLTGNPEPNYYVVRKWAAENATEEPIVLPKASVGLYYNFDSSWAYFVDQWRPEILVPDRQIYPRYLIEVVYQTIFDLELPSDILFEPSGLGDYEYVIVPRHLLYDPVLESALLGYVTGGGTLITTTDLFRRNSDNAWLEYVPDIYRSVFGWTSIDFPDDSVPPEAFQTIQSRLGKGSAYMIHKDAPHAAWNFILSSGKSGSRRRSFNTQPQSGECVYDQRGRAPLLALNGELEQPVTII